MYTVKITNNGAVTTIMRDGGSDYYYSEYREALYPATSLYPADDVYPDGGSEASASSVGRYLLSAKVKKEVNKVDSFCFDIYPDNPGYQLLTPFATLIEVYDEIHDVVEFSGRVLTVDPCMKKDGEVYKSVTCESKLGYLNDSIQNYAVTQNWTVNGFLSEVISTHNSKVEAAKQVTIRNVTVTDPNDNLYLGIQYKTTWETLQKLIEKLGGEIQLVEDNGTLYLDYLTQIGSTSTTEIALSENMQSLSQETDSGSIITRLIPLGAKIKTTDANGNSSETEERLTIASANDGVPYIDDETYIARYGIIEAVQTWNDVTTASALKTKGTAWLTNNNRVEVTYSVDAYDLSLIDEDLDQFVVGNTYPVQNGLLGISENLRIIAKTIDLVHPEKTKLEFGSQYKTLSAMQSSITGYVEEQITTSVQSNATVQEANIENTRSYAATIVETAQQLLVEMINSTESTLQSMALEYNALFATLTATDNDLKTRVKFNTDGLTIAMIDDNGNIVSQYNTNYNESGLRVRDTASGNATLIAEGDSVETNNLTSKNFLIIDTGSYKSRFQKFSTTEEPEQIGCFWIGG